MCLYCIVYNSNALEKDGADFGWNSWFDSRCSCVNCDSLPFKTNIW